MLRVDNAVERSYTIVMQGETAQIVITDPPYNCKIMGFVCKTKHKEFAMASGEMSDEQFAEFFNTIIKNLLKFSENGSLHYIFVDWRGINTLLTEGKKVYSELMNILVWNKMVGGQGSHYRSQHELIPIFKKKGKHQNHINMGKYGRYRTKGPSRKIVAELILKTDIMDYKNMIVKRTIEAEPEIPTERQEELRMWLYSKLDELHREQMRQEEQDE